MGLLGLESRVNKISTVEEASQFKDWFDFSLLPPFDALAKYFNFSVWVAASPPTASASPRSLRPSLRPNDESFEYSPKHATLRSQKLLLFKRI